MENQKMPSDQEYEAFILGAILNDKFAQYQSLQELTTDDFYHYQHKKIFETYKTIGKSGRRIDLISTVKILKDDGFLEQAGGIQYLQTLADNYANVEVEYYIEQLRALSAKRELIRIGHEICSRATDPKYKADTLIEKYGREISEIGSYSRDSFVDMREIVENYKNNTDFITVVKDECERVARGEDLFDGVRSYYPRLDKLVGGFANSTNNIIGARSSSGKTTFLSNLFLNISENAPNVRMGFFSLEMKKSRIMEKIVCSLAGVNFKNLQERKLSTEEFEKIFQSQEKIKAMNLTIFDHSGININELKSHTRRECIRGGLDIVFLDYLSIVQATDKTGNKHQEIDQVSKGLQAISLELNIPMVTLSQLNRNIYSRVDKTPVLADLRESGSIEEDADLVMLLHRPIHYMSANEEAKEDVTQLIVAKSRLIGDLGKVEYTFNRGRYEERQYIEEILPNQCVNPTSETQTKWKGGSTGW